MSIIFSQYKVGESCCREEDEDEGTPQLNLPVTAFRLTRPLTQAEIGQISLLQEQLGELACINLPNDFEIECTAHCTPFIRAWLLILR